MNALLGPIARLLIKCSFTLVAAIMTSGLLWMIGALWLLVLETWKL